MSDHTPQLMDRLKEALDDHQAEFGESASTVIFDALGAMGYVSGFLLASAPSQAKRDLAYNHFMRAFKSGLEDEVVGTRH